MPAQHSSGCGAVAPNLPLLSGAGAADTGSLQHTRRPGYTVAGPRMANVPSGHGLTLAWSWPRGHGHVVTVGRSLWWSRSACRGRLVSLAVFWSRSRGHGQAPRGFEAVDIIPECAVCGHVTPCRAVLPSPTCLQTAPPLLTYFSLFHPSLSFTAPMPQPQVAHAADPLVFDRVRRPNRGNGLAGARTRRCRPAPRRHTHTRTHARTHAHMLSGLPMEVLDRHPEQREGGREEGEMD